MTPSQSAITEAPLDQAPESKDPLTLLTQAAENGDHEAQFQLGELYGKRRDKSQALHWFRRAAEGGHSEAQYTLGLMYDLGIDVAGDLAQATKWYRQAAQQGHRDAQRKLCKLPNTDVVCARLAAQLAHEQGMDTGWIGDDPAAKQAQEDLARAAEAERKRILVRLIRSAEQGDLESQYELGNQYRSGPQQDLTQTVKWWRAAALVGHVNAQYELAQLYQSGLGVPQDLAQAEKWLRASIQGRFGTLGIVVPPISSDIEVTLHRVNRSRGGYSVDIPATGTPADAAIILIYAGALLGQTVEHLVDKRRVKKAKKATKALQNHVRASNVVKEIEERVLTTAREELSNPVRRAGSAGEEIAEKYQYLHDQGIDTVLEVILQTIGLMEDESGDSDRIRLVMDARSRLITTATGSVIDEDDFRHNGAPREISDWLADDANAFQDALEVGKGDLAKQIVKSMFGMDLSEVPSVPAVDGLPPVDSQGRLKVAILPIEYTSLAMAPLTPETVAEKAKRVINGMPTLELVDSDQIQGMELMLKNRVWNKLSDRAWVPNFNLIYTQGAQAGIDAAVMVFFTSDYTWGLFYNDAELYVIDLRRRSMLRQSIPTTIDDLDIEKKLRAMLEKTVAASRSEDAAEANPR